MVEFALGLPALLLLLIGLAELGRAVLTYTTVSNATREAARYAVMTTVIDPAPVLASESHPDIQAGMPTWWQHCNRGRDATDTPSYKEYLATDGNCAGWPNVVSTIVQYGYTLSLSDTKVRITYHRPPPVPPYPNVLAGYNRSIPLTVTVIHTYHPIVTRFLRVPATINMSSSSTMITQ